MTDSTVTHSARAGAASAVGAFIPPLLLDPFVHLPHPGADHVHGRQSGWLGGASSSPFRWCRVCPGR